MNRLVPRHHIGPVLEVMVGVDDSEHGMMHVSELRASRDIENVELYLLSIGRRPGHHPRPVAGIAIVGKEQPVAIQIKNGHRMVVASRIVRRSELLHLMHHRISPRVTRNETCTGLSVFISGCGGSPVTRAFPLAASV